MERPNLTFQIVVNEELKDVKLSYALLNEILQVVPDPTNIAGLLIQDASLRDYIARRVLTGNKPVLKNEDLIDMFETDVDPRAIGEMLTWIGDHVLYFFMTSAVEAEKLGRKYEATITQLVQSKNGAESSASETPSAGPSESPKETSTASSGDTPTES